MDKLHYAKVNLNNLLMGLSTALDKSFDNNRYGVEYSSQRVAYIAIRVASYIKFEDEYLSDVISYGLIARYEYNTEEFQSIPFLNHDNIDKNTKDILKLALLVEENLQISSHIIINMKQITELISKSDFLSDEIKESFIDLSEDMTFWLDLTNKYELPTLIYNFLQDFTIEMEYTVLVNFAKLLYKRVNNSLGIFEKYEIENEIRELCQNFHMDNKDISRFIIAFYLESLGKLFVPKRVYNEKTDLSYNERVAIEGVSYFSAKAVGLVYGFDDIAKLCSMSHEKLDGTGKPFEMDGSGLSLKDRLMAVLIIYQALREKRSYREAYSHKEAVQILYSDVKNGKLDQSIVEEVERVFEG